MIKRLILSSLLAIATAFPSLAQDVAPGETALGAVIRQTQTKSNTVLASPLSGAAGLLKLRPLGGADLPSPTLLAAQPPPGLPSHLGLGVFNGDSQLSWMTTTTAPTPWDYRYTYDVLALNNQFLINYVQNSYNNGYVPIITEFSIGGQTWGNPSGGLFTSAGLQNPANMNTYFTTFVARLLDIQQVTNGSFDNNRVNASVTLSGSNLIATQNANTATNFVTPAVISHGSGRWTFKVTATNLAGSGVGVGLQTTSNALGTYCGFNTQAICWFSNGQVTIGNSPLTSSWPTYATGNVLTVAVDLIHSKIWGRVGVGNWDNDVIANQNPDTNTGGISIAGLSEVTTLFPTINTSTINDSVTADFLTGSGLTNFTPWNDPSGRPGPPVLHIEPDLSGFMEQTYGDNANAVLVSVTSSGYAGVAGFANTGAGFYQALLALRNANAPGILMAFHVSPWGPSNNCIGGAANGCNFLFPNGGAPNVAVNSAATGAHVVAFYNSVGAKYDLMFYDPADADAGYKVVVRGNSAANAWWTTPGSFTAWSTWLAAIYNATQLRGMIWQIPVGNTISLSQDNTSYHYQDNHLQYYLNSTNGYAVAKGFVNSGIIGLLFGQGQTTDTDPYALSGIVAPYNPAVCPTCNPFGIANNQTSTVVQDDGGVFAASGAAYYVAGAISTTAPTLTCDNVTVTCAAGVVSTRNTVDILTSATYPIVSSDGGRTKLDNYQLGTAAWTIPQATVATGAFPPGWATNVCTDGGNSVVITPATSKIAGQASYLLPGFSCIWILSDGTNYTVAPTSQSVYVGPGDVNPGASFHYGLVAFNRANLNGTTAALTIRRASDSATRVENILPQGSPYAGWVNFLDAQGWCAGTTCTITQFNDLTGTNGVASQATVADQYTLTFNCDGPYPCATSPASAGGYSATIASAVIAQASVLVKTTSLASANVLMCLGPCSTATNETEFYLTSGAGVTNSTQSGSFATGTVVLNRWYKLNMLAGTSGATNIDGTDTAGNSGAPVAVTALYLGSDNQPALSTVGAVIYWAGGAGANVATQRAALCGNAYLNTGLGAQCPP